MWGGEGGHGKGPDVLCIPGIDMHQASSHSGYHQEMFSVKFRIKTN